MRLARLGIHLILILAVVAVWELVRGWVLVTYHATGGGSLFIAILNHMLYVALILIGWESLKTLVLQRKKPSRSL